MRNLNIKKSISKLVRFNKIELHKILAIYSKKIAIGEWKDYSICFKRNYAIFSIHKSFQLAPTFEIMKQVNKKGNFTLLYNNRIVSKTHSLNEILSYLKKPNLRLIR